VSNLVAIAYDDEATANGGHVLQTSLSDDREQDLQAALDRRGAAV
jgi:uncharacterized membrane protein